MIAMKVEMMKRDKLQWMDERGGTVQLWLTTDDNVSFPTRAELRLQSLQQPLTGVIDPEDVMC